ncbi:PAS domain-containing protein [Litorivicinus lipolyticus]|uniref:histidine kinase n=1 Tax=Litorivicinus lipolyticus TaxID=418701 RepID=A0A5Q2QEE1_9GAMM|nr:ATP-binding protein [Litorivicinus lipolyticus]QGG80230.1 PAS domain-containing protein [Litorivicinus lipolyticus]
MSNLAVLTPTQSNSRFDSLIHVLPDAVLVVGADGRVEQQNPAAFELLGTSLLGDLWSDAIGHLFAPKPDDGHEISLANGRQVSLKTVALPAGDGQLVVMTDMSQTRALQRARAHQDRLAQMGQMAASLAHQIRTPLSTAMLYAEQLNAPHLMADQRKRFAGRLSASLSGLSAQLDDMLSYSRGELKRDDRLSVSEFWRALRTSIGSQLPATARATYALDDSLRPIQIAKSALTGALLNLVRNSIQVADGRGRLLQLMLRGRIEGDTLVLTLTDNAGGLQGINARELMQPFKTARKGGTGLGLCVADGIIQAHQGSLHIREIGDGVRVDVRVPLEVG